MKNKNIKYIYNKKTYYIKFQQAKAEENKMYSNMRLTVCPKGDIGSVLPSTRIKTLANKNIHKKRRGKDLFQLLQPPDGEKEDSISLNLSELETTCPYEGSPRPPKQRNRGSIVEMHTNLK